MTDENEKCCCCFKPRTGAFIVGYITLVYILSEMIYLTVNLLTFEVPEGESDVDARALQTFLNMVIGTSLFIYALYLAFTTALIVGLHQDKPNHVLAFIKFQYSIIAIYIIGLFSYIWHFDSAMFTINLFITTTTIYHSVVVKSYHDKMLVFGNGAGAVLTVA